MTYSNDYFYGNESEQYTFIRFPKALMSDLKYKKLSDGAKILYGLMLDRMGLSRKNNWLDDNNRVYIYFTMEDVKEQMCCGNDKALKMLAELDSNKGVGLIERKKQGQGKPTIIYVKKFISDDNYNSELTEPDYEHNFSIEQSENGDNLTSEKPNSASNISTNIEGNNSEYSKYLHFEKPKYGLNEVLTSEKPKPEQRENRSLDLGKTDTNNNNINNNNFNNIESKSMSSHNKSNNDFDSDSDFEIQSNIEHNKKNINNADDIKLIDLNLLENKIKEQINYEWLIDSNTRIKMKLIHLF